jgi:hypothetical protein
MKIAWWARRGKRKGIEQGEQGCVKEGNNYSMLSGIVDPAPTTGGTINRTRLAVKKEDNCGNEGSAVTEDTIQPV